MRLEPTAPLSQVKHTLPMSHCAPKNQVFLQQGTWGFELSAYVLYTAV